jgi:hypothetical protein
MPAALHVKKEKGSCSRSVVSLCRRWRSDAGSLQKKREGEVSPERSDAGRRHAVRDMAAREVAGVGRGGLARPALAIGLGGKNGQQRRRCSGDCLVSLGARGRGARRGRRRQLFQRRLLCRVARLEELGGGRGWRRRQQLRSTTGSCGSDTVRRWGATVVCCDALLGTSRRRRGFGLREASEAARELGNDAAREEATPRSPGGKAAWTSVEARPETCTAEKRMNGGRVMDGNGDLRGLDAATTRPALGAQLGTRTRPRVPRHRQRRGVRCSVCKGRQRQVWLGLGASKAETAGCGGGWGRRLGQRLGPGAWGEAEWGIAITCGQ